MNENEGHQKQDLHITDSHRINNHNKNIFYSYKQNNFSIKSENKTLNKFDKHDTGVRQENIGMFEKIKAENRINDLKNCYSEQEKNKTNSNQTNSNDSDNYKKYFNKTTSSQLITTSNSIHFNSFENNSKTTPKPKNRNFFLIAKNEINIDLESINEKNDSTCTNINNENIVRNSAIYASNSNKYTNITNNKDFIANCRIDQPIRIDFLNKKRIQDTLNDGNDFSKIKHDLCPNSNYQGYKIEKNNISNFCYGFLSDFSKGVKKRKLNSNEIIEDLKFKLLKYNLEKKKTHNISDIEKQISKEIFFHQLFRLFTSKDNKIIKSFIIKKINELIVEDDIFENLLLLSKFQVFKDSSIDKIKLKKKNLLKIIDMITSNNLMYRNLNEFIDSDSSEIEEESNSLKNNILEGSKINIVKESVDKFIEFLDSHGFQILHDASKNLINSDNQKKITKTKNISSIIFNDNKRKKMRVLKLRNINKENSILNKIENINCENNFKCSIKKERSTVNSLLYSNNKDYIESEKNNISINLYKANINSGYDQKKINNEVKYLDNNINSPKNNNNNDNNFYLINVVNSKSLNDFKDFSQSSHPENNEFQNKIRKNREREIYNKFSPEKKIDGIKSIIQKDNVSYGIIEKMPVNFSNQRNNIDEKYCKNSIESKKLFSKVRRAWLCSHIDKLNYARGKCQNCYSNFYHKKANCNILTKF